MKTIIFDIDGTLTNMWPIEKSVLLCMTGGKFKNEIEELKKFGIQDTYKIFCKVTRNILSKNKYFTLYNESFLKLKRPPKLEKYPTVHWIKKNKDKYVFVYATGGQKSETEYVLNQLGIINYFDLKNSVSKSNCRFSKKTGIPLKRITTMYPDSFFITDSKNDYLGAIKINLGCMQIKPGEKFLPDFS